MRRLFFLILALVCLAPELGAQVTSTDPQTRYRDTDQTLPAGLWRIRFNGNTFTVEKNTSATGDFATYTIPMSVSAAGVVTFLTPPTITGLTAYGMTYSSATGQLTSTAAPTNGQLLVGVTSGVPVLASITGTSNQLTVTAGSGSITLSLPQNIHTAATPTFAGLIAPAVGPAGGQQHALPAVSSDTIALLAATQTFTNKTLTSPTINAGALSGTFSGTPTISTPTITTLTLTNPLTVANGGTGVATLASNGVLYGNGSGVALVTAQGAANTVLTANAGAPSFSAAPTLTSLTTTSTITAGAAVLLADGLMATPAIAFNSDPDVGIYRVANNNGALVSNNAKILQWDSTTVYVNQLTLDIANADVRLVREGANILAMRNSTNAQHFYEYNTFTDASNYERGSIGWGIEANVFRISTTALGTGTARKIRIYPSGTGTTAWDFQPTGVFGPADDNVQDLGAAASQRVRTGYFGTAVTIGTNPATTGAVRLANNTSIIWRNAANSSDDGVIYFTGSNGFQFDATAGTVFQFNPNMRDIDFTIASDTNANHFVSDAGAFAGAGAFGFGSAVSGGNVYFAVDSPALTGPNNTSTYRAAFGGSNAVTLSGTVPVAATLLINEPNLVGTVTDAYTVYISGAPTEGTRNGALWVAAGTSRFDGAIQSTGVAFASLPTGVAGMMMYVSDSNTNTWGATVAGGGANKVLAFYNGSAWTVAGK